MATYIWVNIDYKVMACFPTAPNPLHDDVIKWKHLPRYWPFVRGIHRSPVNSPHKGQWRGALMFSLICARINDWVNNREAGDLRRYRAHYDVIVMTWTDIDLASVWSSYNHTISQEVPQPFNFKMIYLKFHSDLPVSNELMTGYALIMHFWRFGKRAILYACCK